MTPVSYTSLEDLKEIRKRNSSLGFLYFNEPHDVFDAEYTNLRHWEEIEQTSQEVQVRSKTQSTLKPWLAPLRAITDKGSPGTR